MAKQTPKRRVSAARTAQRNALVESHLHLVRSIAMRIKEQLPSFIDQEDLTHAGAIGLIDAADKFDGSKNIAFSTYAKHRIRGAILDNLRQMDWASREVRKQIRKVDLATVQLRRKLNRDPNEEELAASLNMSLELWRKVSNSLVKVEFVSADLCRPGYDDPILNDLKAYEGAQILPGGPDRTCELGEMRDALRGALKSLPKRYQLMVELYYSRDKTMKEIGKVLHVNESRVSQMHKLALQKLQDALGEQGLSGGAFAI